MGLGHDLKDLIQLRIRQDLGVGLGLFAELADDLADLLGSHTEIGSQLLQTYFHKTHIKTHLRYSLGSTVLPN